MAGQLTLKLGVDAVTALDAAAKERGVTVQDLVRLALSASGVRIPEMYSGGRPVKQSRADAGTVYVLLKPEGMQDLDRVSREQFRSKTQLVRMGLEALGVVLPPARPVGNPAWQVGCGD